MSQKKSGEPWFISIGGETVILKDPDGAIQSLKDQGLLSDFIEDLSKEVEFLRTLQELIDDGHVEQTKGTPNFQLLEGTERLLELCKQKTRE